MDNRRFIIIGGGVAGLAVACRLVDHGIQPLILEGSSFPAHKVCGEFFSPECLPQLSQWGITFDQTIDKALFITKGTSLVLSFDRPAGSMSHLKFDAKLLAYALKKGAEFLPQERVLNVNPLNGGFQVITEKHGILPCSHLFIAAGRLPFFPSKNKAIYQGAKAYFTHLNLQSPLMMFSFKRCYAGISEVDTGVYNVAMLSSRKSLPSLEQLASENLEFARVFENGKMVFPTWMTASIPPFGIKRNPFFHNAFFIGDAQNTIPPASGAGLSLSIASGILSADYAIKDDALGFQKEWQKKHYIRLKAAKLLHQCLLRPFLFKTFCQTGNLFPNLDKKLFNLTREPFFL